MAAVGLILRTGTEPIPCSPGEPARRCRDEVMNVASIAPTGCRATGVWDTSPVDRTVAREHHMGGHSGGRVGLEAERSSRHAVTN